MTDARHPSPAAGLRARLAGLRKAVVSACAVPQSVTLLRLDSEEVAHMLRQARETGSPRPPQG